MSGQRKEEAKLSRIFLLLHLPQYFQHYTQEISFNVYTVLPSKGALLPQFPTTTVYNTCHCILQCTCHTCIFDIHTSATILNSHYSSTHSCEKTPEECGEGTDCHLTTEISQSNS